MPRYARGYVLEGAIRLEQVVTELRFQQVYSRRFACSRRVEVGLPIVATGVDRGGFGHNEEDYRYVRILRSQDRMRVVGWWI
jgi:hypothetical protein